MDVNETLLPGVGLRYEFDNADGDRIGVIAHRKGHFEVLVYASKDPDRARRVFRLTEREAEAMAQILGAPRMVESYADLTKEVPGLDAGQVEVGSHSPYAGRPLGDTQARTRTGASIVAVVRDEQVLASPGPDEMLHAHDVLVVIGTADGIVAVRQLVEQG
ncbi:cation:proton antiporter regulatory subunit [Mycolicibacterium sp.]|uniref:cation:proton antiporter regulatory subunit n=1 Tax=Mycolicibacterium sp. TaxID=2320850 RepID=UPI0028AEC90B|nr:cation:proton antiporter regulatory subunit [Mycolicibacterium sp.]